MKIQRFCAHFLALLQLFHCANAFTTKIHLTRMKIPGNNHGSRMKWSYFLSNGSPKNDFDRAKNLQTAVMQSSAPRPSSNEIDWRGLEQVGDDWVRYGPKLEESNRNEAELPDPRWYIVQCTPGLEDNVKMMLQSKINNSAWLQKTILEVLVPTTKVAKVELDLYTHKRTLYVSLRAIQ